MFKSAILKKGILILGILLVVAGIVYAAESYRVLAPGGATEINEWGICKEVVNNNSQDLFVPTRTQEEWSSLVNHGAPNVNVNDCAVTCAPVNDYCGSYHYVCECPFYNLSSGLCEGVYTCWEECSYTCTEYNCTDGRTYTDC